PLGWLKPRRHEVGRSHRKTRRPVRGRRSSGSGNDRDVMETGERWVHGFLRPLQWSKRPPCSRKTRRCRTGNLPQDTPALTGRRTQNGEVSLDPGTEIYL